MESKSHALAAGAFVLVVFGLLIALAAWLMRDDADTVEYEMATFDAVTGLQEQASVRYKGVTVGKVTDITFSQEGEVLVRLAISPDTPITKSTYATLNLQGVTGLSFVQLNDHEEDRTPLAAGPNGVPRIPLHPGLLSIMAFEYRMAAGSLV
ncbi:MAG: MCE family protein, partial [Ottowia sp.]|nr:MCE family protein [Ottowia sp.]